MSGLTTCQVQRTIFTRVPALEVWDILTNPLYTRQYMFSTSVQSDWVIGSPITWAGIHAGQEVGGKGKIINAEPGRQLKYSTFNPHHGLLDIAENYLVVTYDMFELDGKTGVNITIENFNGDAKRCDSIAKEWDAVVIPELTRLVN